MTDNIYFLPIDNSKSIIISQGFNSLVSHKLISPTLNQSYSLDFATEYGSEVLASRSGVISKLYLNMNDFYEGIDIKKATGMIGNYIEIKHIDNTIGHYQHLCSDSIDLTIGDKVCSGDLIARTGRSGWVGPVPHLHFMVYDIIFSSSGRKNITRKICFSNYDGLLEDKLLNL